ncbi:MAG: YggS family pyridoxal phosphate-dependent enzyme [Candidatus Omnitrophica bacterium]|nr:YggS family pyridoxal phosphate-dependent enzyme [Candidatus Omnitrophota bacterium]
MSASIAERVAQVRERIEAAARRSGRSAGEITLVAVTKGVSAEGIKAARAAGLSFFGENRVQEAAAKIPAGSPGEWHMIGHLQTNKVAEAVRMFQMVQSVDSVRLAGKIDEECARADRTMPVLFEVNVAGEAQKYGFKPEEIYAALDAAERLGRLRLVGLMGMAPNSAEAGPRREAFKKLRNIFNVLKSIKKENVEMRYLSMGMSDDFEPAIEEGSNMVRIGRAIFR